MCKQFSGGNALCEPGGTIVFVMVVEAEKSQIGRPVVRRIVIDMSDLPLAFATIASEPVAEATAP